MFEIQVDLVLPLVLDILSPLLMIILECLLTKDPSRLLSIFSTFYAKIKNQFGIYMQWQCQGIFFLLFFVISIE